MSMPAPAPRLRVVTLNLWGDRAPLAARHALAAAGLAALAPDVVLVQEARRGDGLACTATALAGRLAARTAAPWRAEFRCATAGPPGTWGPGSGAGEEGLAVLSPHAVEDVRDVELPEARDTERRILLSARVAGWWVHTTHLHWRRRDGAARRAQVDAVERAVRGLGPGPHVVAGDFNAAPDTEEIRAFVAAGWRDAWVVARGAEPGLTWAARNPNTAQLAHVAPLDRRIDLVFVSPDVRVERAEVVLDEPDAAGLWPSDHFGVLVDLALATLTP
jgi:endonuclease/exonuclease/phosphatase family metal-dependent hydrolase